MSVDRNQIKQALEDLQEHYSDMTGGNIYQWSDQELISVLLEQLGAPRIPSEVGPIVDYDQQETTNILESIRQNSDLFDRGE